MMQWQVEIAVDLIVATSTKPALPLAKMEDKTHGNPLFDWRPRNGRSA
uniref:Uncharacterized protein n=1 Tax=Anguilla anguilla TaxID=7936 RepID=A0A0E9PWJ9_ANGAN